MLSKIYWLNFSWFIPTKVAVAQLSAISSFLDCKTVYWKLDGFQNKKCIFSLLKQFDKDYIFGFQSYTLHRLNVHHLIVCSAYSLFLLTFLEKFTGQIVVFCWFQLQLIKIFWCILMTDIDWPCCWVQHKCYIVATCDRDLKRRIRKVE